MPSLSGSLHCLPLAVTTTSELLLCHSDPHSGVVARSYTLSSTRSAPHSRKSATPGGDSQLVNAPYQRPVVVICTAPNLTFRRRFVRQQTALPIRDVAIVTAEIVVCKAKASAQPQRNPPHETVVRAYVCACVCVCACEG